MRHIAAGIIALGLASTWLAAQDAGAPVDSSPHQIRLLTVSDDVQLEVLEWGGNGRPVVFLAGLGNTAHVFDQFAPQFANEARVVAITRRGFGASSKPETGYTVDRLGDDVLAVIDHLALTKPILVGHSIAGQELSYIATKDPSRIAGLIYLDAAYRYAYMEKETPPDFGPMPAPPPAPRPEPADLQSVAAYRKWSMRVQGFALPDAELRQVRTMAPDGSVGAGRTSPSISQAIQSGSRRFVDIRVPALAIFASPHALGPWTNDRPGDRAAFDAFARFDEALTETQAASFEQGVSGSRVVRLRNAGHYLFLTNEAQVQDAMRSFIRTLR